MENKTKENPTNENGTNNGGQQRPKDGIIVRTAKAVKRGYLRIRATKTGRVVIEGSKCALMALGLWKSYELLSSGKKEEEPTYVVIQPIPETTAEETPAETTTEEVKEEEVVTE